MIESIRNFISDCPLLKDGRVNVDYIGTDMSYSLDPLPCDPVITTYVDGGTKRQFQFAFTSKEEYDEDARVNIDNSEFCQKFEDWLEEKNNADSFPVLPDGRIPIKFETLNKGYLYDIDGALAKYRIECRLLYEQEV
ncbi:MAG: hypothetical protein ACI4S2_01440 [Lachnospiraceae bacterium]